ncbi:F-box associated interaction domain [Arabidopsis thaliana x Arabidopsis arenosa]|uniref:F-box associated interaction domain n=1 Tax=Arabidopsis thaliana x Arabidopsis arenosa TaxID=1240361 RepID=A0A8T2C2M9_9BRAS|nr:F-box associated interaction domain [Arabidopsis thaliana x Arabidopsis arenosa]
MKREVPTTIDSTDLILEILSRTSAKSISRFRRSSKFWSSILRHQYFTELFLTRSSTRPRLLISLEKSGDLIFCSSPQFQNPEGSSLVVTAEFHISFPADWCLQNCCAVSGLIYCPNSPKSVDRLPLICKPSTGQQVSLPNAKKTKEFVHNFFGYDPILKQFKVMVISHDKDAVAEEFQILTLGTGKWRLRKGILHHYPLSEGICINGVLYYIGHRVVSSVVVIACFDFRSEKKFSLIREVNGVTLWARPSVLVNYKGKLGGIQSEWRANVDGRLNLELTLWVLEDVKKAEFSKHVYNLPELWENRNVNASVSIAGVTSTGEIVLSMEYTSNPFYVFYYNLDSYTLHRVEIQGIEALESYRVRAFVDHVEDLKFLTSS